MELNELIQQLVDSNMTENQELAISLLASDSLTDEEKRKHIDKFINSYLRGEVNWDVPEQKHIFDGWVEIYLRCQRMEVKNRVKKIE